MTTKQSPRAMTRLGEMSKVVCATLYTTLNHLTVGQATSGCIADRASTTITASYFRRMINGIRHGTC